MIMSFTELLAESDINFNFSKSRESQMEMHMIGVLISSVSYN